MYLIKTKSPAVEENHHSRFLFNFVANSRETITECLRRLLDASDVRPIVSEATLEGGEDSVARYLHDFTHMVYKPQNEVELEVIVNR